MPNHFGVTVNKGKYGLKLTRENYAVVSKKNTLPKFSLDIYADDQGMKYTDEWCAKQLEDCLKNFDLNMEFMSLFNRDKFNEEINEFLKNNKRFREVFDLNHYDEKPEYELLETHEKLILEAFQILNKRRISA